MEVHGANGYFIDQFLRDGSNKREDQYGGDYKNRTHFLFDVLKTVTAVWASDRVGVRLSPSISFNSMSNSNSEALFNYVVKGLNPLNLAYVHVLEGGIHVDNYIADNYFNYSGLHNIYTGTYMANNGYNKDSANQAMKVSSTQSNFNCYIRC